jgi:ABC-type xylose transport system permease subunit
VLDSVREVAWPPAFGDWFDLLLLTLIVLFKLRRGTLLRRRARYIDRIGLSTILADYALGLAYLYALLVTLYPQLRPHEEIRWPVRIMVSVVVGWAWWTAERASTDRINMAMGGREHAATFDGDLPVWNRTVPPVGEGE